MVALVGAIQGIYIIKADKTARMAAESAKKSAEVLPMIERAYLSTAVKYASVSHKTVMVDTFPLELPYRYLVTFKNNGKTPAILLNIYCEGNVLETVPNEWDFRPQRQQFNEGWVVASGEELSFPFEIHDVLDLGQLQGVAMDSKFYAMGYIEYKDVTKEIRKTGYCWVFNKHSEEFNFCGDSKLNNWT